MTTSNFLDTTYGEKINELHQDNQIFHKACLKTNSMKNLLSQSDFMGGKCSTKKIKVHYSTIVKSELRNCDRRVTEYIENIFF